MWKRTVFYAVVAGAFVVTLRAQTRDALEVQKARSEHVESRAKKTWYTKKFDLSGIPEYQPKQQVSGVLREWGDNYFQDSNMNQYWETDFKKFHPDISFTYHNKTAIAAVPALYMGLADLGPDRMVTFSELLGYQRYMDRDPLEIIVGTGSFDVPGWSPALAVVVNKANPLAKLSIDQLDGIFGTERNGGWIGTTWHPEAARGADKNIRMWGQMGLTGAWKNKPIHVYGVNLRYDMTNGFQLRVFNGGDKWNEHLIEYANYVKGDGSFVIAGPQMLEDLQKDPYGIAYVSSVSYITPDMKVKVLPLAARGSQSYIMPTLDTVQNRTYPLVSDVYIYVNTPVEPKVKEFLRYTLSRQGQDAIQRDGKYLPLTPEMDHVQLKKLE